jgi:hypothetical protein
MGVPKPHAPMSSEVWRRPEQDSSSGVHDDPSNCHAYFTVPCGSSHSGCICEHAPGSNSIVASGLVTPSTRTRVGFLPEQLASHADMLRSLNGGAQTSQLLYSAFFRTAQITFDVVDILIHNRGYRTFTLCSVLPSSAPMSRSKLLRLRFPRFRRAKVRICGIRSACCGGTTGRLRPEGVYASCRKNVCSVVPSFTNDDLISAKV